MKVHDLLENQIIDSIKRKLGKYQGWVVSSVQNLLSAFKKNPQQILTTIETFGVIEFSKKYISRVDTGALVCSVQATDIELEGDQVKFNHEGKEYKLPLLRMKEVKNANGSATRARVKLSYQWNGKTYHGIETSLADRSKMKFPLLIGRNLIKELKLPVHISDSEVE